MPGVTGTVRIRSPGVEGGVVGMSERDRIAALERQNARLQRKLDALRSSTALRVGETIVGTAQRVLPTSVVDRIRARRPGGADPAAGPAGAAVPAGTAGAPEPSTAAVPAARGVAELPTFEVTERPSFPAPGEQAVSRRRPQITPTDHGDVGAVPDGPIFVGGTGRSGTWVIGRLLHAHPAWVTIHTELRYQADGPGIVDVLAGRETPEAFAERVSATFLDVIGPSGKPKGLQVVAGGGEVRRALQRFVQRAESDVADALGQLLLEVVEPFVRGREGLGWSETTPGNVRVADALLTVLPKAKLIHTIRDGRDVAASVAKMPWGPNSIERALDWWAGRVWAGHLGTVGADQSRLLRVRLEELVHLDRDRQLERLVSFTGFEDDKPMRAYFEKHINATRGNVGRWRNQVDAAERDRVDRRYRDLLGRLEAAGVTHLPTPPDAVDELAAPQGVPTA
ncbi:sulfotransferase [Egicoccus sp. AB-alg2]|uniref:sulfotransferase family protein n=1 Tax=Egicoccus sp. AB-alg2 TaxID=3242693 RepID=UPI00359E9324